MVYDERRQSPSRSRKLPNIAIRVITSDFMESCRTLQSLLVHPRELKRHTGALRSSRRRADAAARQTGRGLCTRDQRIMDLTKRFRQVYERLFTSLEGAPENPGPAAGTAPAIPQLSALLNRYQDDVAAVLADCVRDAADRNEVSSRDGRRWNADSLQEFWPVFLTWARGDPPRLLRFLDYALMGGNPAAFFLRISTRLARSRLTAEQRRTDGGECLTDELPYADLPLLSNRETISHVPEGIAASVRNAILTLGPIEAGRRSLVKAEDIQTLMADPDELEHLSLAIFCSDRSFYRRTGGER